MPQALDPRLPQKYVVGKDAELYMGAAGDAAHAGTFLLHVSTWQLEGNIADEQEQPPGQALILSVPTGYSFRLSLTESVIRTGDKFFLETIMAAVDRGEVPYFSFQGQIGTRQVPLEDGSLSTIAVVSIDYCQPTGAFDLANIRPGGILRRALNFNVNSIPKFASYL